MVIIFKISVICMEKRLTVSRKMVKYITARRKSHQPIETLGI